ncbi:MAG: B12-binding domain-containing radical SAM protein [Thermodesulfobacteriota bacterium]
MPSESTSPLILIHPPAVSKRYLKTKFMPYGMAVIYAYLKEHGIPVEQHDYLMEYLFDAPEDIDFHNPAMSFTEKDFLTYLRDGSGHPGLAAFAEKYGSGLVSDRGFYAFSIVAYHQFWASLLLSRYIRAHDRHAVIVFGGPFITIKPTESIIHYGLADYWVKGSGELPLLMLYKMHRGSGGHSLKDIPGLIFMQDGEFVENPRSEPAAIGERAPDFEGLDLEQYCYDHPLTGDQTLFLPYRITKGCPSRCTFCTGRLVDRYAVKPVEKVVSELISLSQLYQTNNFMFADASVNGSPRLLERVCDELIRRFPNIRWYAYARVRGFDSRLLTKVRNAGCFSLFWGLESAHQPTVELLGKRFQVERMYEVIDQAIELGIKNYIHIMYNTPHETEADAKAFIRLVERYIDSPMVVFLPGRFLLEPQSLMFQDPEAYGLANIEKVGTSLFEREQYTYDESGTGLNSEDVLRRNEEHKRKLGDHLEWIRYQAMTRNSKSRVVRMIPSRLLMRTANHARRSRLAAHLHDALVNWVESTARSLGEQM